MTQTLDLTGKVALVTGASRGIGQATALRLAEAGASVAVIARTKDALAETVARIEETGGKALPLACDVGRMADVTRAFEAARAAFGSLDILVNNAGTVEPIARIEDGDPADWAGAIQTNVLGTYHGVRAALPVMAARGSGTIVTISSGAANSALEGWSAYCVSKAATKKLTEVAHKEAHAQGVRVVGLSPGTVATDMMARIKDSGVNPVSQLDWSTHIPPEWAAEAVLYLCGPGGDAHLGTDFSIKTDEGRRAVGLPTEDEREDGTRPVRMMVRSATRTGR